MWASGLCVIAEVNVIDNRADISQVVTSTQASCKAAPQLYQSSPPTGDQNIPQYKASGDYNIP